MSRHIHAIWKKSRMRDVRNIILLSIITIVLLQAITNASLIQVMVSHWIYGVNTTHTPKESLTISNTQTSPDIPQYTDQIEKLLAANNTHTNHRTTLTPSMEDTLSHKAYKDNFAFNTLPPVNKITIGSIGIDAPIVSVFFKDSEEIMVGDFDEELKNGVATYPGTANPGNPGHSLIFGHSSQERWKKNDYQTIFSMINELEHGDTFTVTRKGKLLTYRVKAQTIVEPTNVIDVYHEYNTQDTNTLSLVTCWPRGTDRKRMIVTSELIDASNHQDNLLTYTTH